VAGVALGDIYRHFAWQAWHLATSIVTLRGRWRHPPSLCVAGVAFGDIDCHLAWQAWHLWHWAGFGGALGSRCAARRRGSFGVAGVSLGDIHRHFAWQAWHLATSIIFCWKKLTCGFIRSFIFCNVYQRVVWDFMG